MTYSDRLTGSDLLVIFLPDGGTAPADNVTMTGDQTAFKASFKLDTVDVTAGNEKERAFKDTIESMDFSMTVFDANQSWQGVVKNRSQGKFTVMKEGLGTGKPVISFIGLVTGYDEDFPFDGALEINISGVRQGAMIDDIGTLQS